MPVNGVCALVCMDMFVLLLLGIVMRSAEPTIMISLVEGSDAIAYVISVWSMELSC